MKTTEFTKIPNWLLDKYNNLTDAEFRVLTAIYRLTVGYARNQYKISQKKLKKMTGVKNMSNIAKSLKKKHFIDYEHESGKASVIKIIIKPNNSVSRLEEKATNSVNSTESLSETHRLTELNGSRGAKENNKENLNKKYFDMFKDKYPKDKFDDKVLDVWDTLSLKNKEIASGVMKFQINGWSDMDKKYIPKASNYLLKKKFLDESVYKPYKDTKLRKKEQIEQREYFKQSRENPATDEERKEALGLFLNKKNKKIK